MLFNSIHYFLFFPLVAGLYFLLKPCFRWMLLLLASYYFYASWRVEYVGLIVLSTLVDYYAGLRMGDEPVQEKRKKWLWLSLLVNLGLLGTFKYLGFLFESANAAFAATGLALELPVPELLLPIGISFYTFQTLSYSLDVYRGAQAPERHLGIFAVYVSFFPQLVAGPIERAGHLLPQFRAVQQVDYQRVTAGLRRILWGLFKKIVIADHLALYVDLVYDQPGTFSGAASVLATVFFAFQIYLDFSAYTDVAIGSAQVLGIRLGENFRRPYFARSLRDFWRRWHISLSAWFRDYVYIPLGGGRVVKWRQGWNLLLTFVLSGLWHGAAWNFVLWGLLHGLLLAVERFSGKWRKNWGVMNRTVVTVPVTFVLVTLLWVFFRAESLQDVGLVFGQIGQATDWSLAALDIQQTRLDLLLDLFWVGLLLLLEYRTRHSSVPELLARQPLALRWTLYYVMVFAMLLMGINAQHPFLYFQF